MNKKTFKQFLDEVIKPIENLNVDNGTLFIFFESEPKINYEASLRPYSSLDYQETRAINYYFGYSESFTFSMPENNNPGMWQTAPQDEISSRKQVFKLKTLFQFLMYGGKGGYLYVAEGRGDIRKLKFDDLWHISTAYEDLDVYQQAKLDVEKSWYDSLNLGVAASEARLIRKVNNLNPYILWQFSIESVDRQIALRKRHNLSVPDIYIEALLFASANSKYMCDMGDKQIEEIINCKVNSKDFHELYWKKREDLELRMNETVEKDFSSKFIGKAIIDLSMPTSPLKPLKELLGQHVYQFWSLYKDEYDITGFTSFLRSDNIEDNKTYHRLCFAATKQELDWQVSHLQKLLSI